MKTGNYEEVLGKVTEFLKDETKTSTVIGTEFKLGEFTCVPVIKVGMGFGYGGGEGEAKVTGHGEGAGAGAGMGIVPIGVRRYVTPTSPQSPPRQAAPAPHSPYSSRSISRWPFPFRRSKRRKARRVCWRSPSAF